MRVTQMSSVSPKKNSVPASVKTSIVPQAPARNLTYSIKEILSRFDKDDYILIGLIAVLIFEGCDDYILLAALGYLFFMGIK